MVRGDWAGLMGWWVVVLCVGGLAWAGPAVDRGTWEAVMCQVGLEAWGFSPGVVDGKIGPKTVMALREFQRVRGLTITGKLDEATVKALGMQEAGDPIVPYTVQAEDVSRVKPVPRGWVDKSKMKYLGYASVLEAVAERFHCTRGLVERLNPGTNLAKLKAGDVVWVPAAVALQLPRAARLEVDLSAKVIRAIDANGRLLGLFHCSIAAKAEKRPKGEARVVSVAENPTYRFDPAMWPEVKGVNRKLLIPPGPKNPVGLCWIGLNLPGYGIHGTPNPELIGKTGSHGCIRLTNWDALRLGRMVGAGTAVKFIGNGPESVVRRAASAGV